MLARKIANTIKKTKFIMTFRVPLIIRQIYLKIELTERIAITHCYLRNVLSISKVVYASEPENVTNRYIMIKVDIWMQ